METRDSGARTRESDDPALAQRVEEVRGEGRRRTLWFAIVGSCIVSLFFAWANDKDQRERSVKNCQLVQADRRDRYQTLKETAADQGRQADSILGNPHPPIGKDGNKHPKPIPPADFSKRPFNAFADFKALIIQQAKQNRRGQARNIARAKGVRARIEDCNKVFPAPNPIPFF